MELMFSIQAGRPWFSILTRTGVFRGKKNHAEFPADLVDEMMISGYMYSQSMEHNWSEEYV